MVDGLLYAALGLAAADGKIDPDAPAPVLNAADPDTGKHAVSDKPPADMCLARDFGGQLIAPAQDALIVTLNAAYTDDIQPIVDLLADLAATIEK